MRSGWVKTSKPSPRALATSVSPRPRPGAPHGRWGRDGDQRGRAKAQVFCTMSRETRLVSTTAPPAGRSRPQHRARELVERVVPAHILAQRGRAPARHPEAGRMGGVGPVVQGLGVRAGRPWRHRPRPGSSVSAAPAATEGTGRSASPRLSIPHRPQPTGPVIARRRAASPAARSSAIHIRASSPAVGHDLEALDLPGPRHDPFVSEKPSANPRGPAARPSSPPASSRCRRAPRASPRPARDASRPCLPPGRTGP
jgi:hypothetical protein